MGNWNGARPSIKNCSRPAFLSGPLAMVENMLWRDTDEGIRAFLEKRKPDWS